MAGSVVVSDLRFADAAAGHGLALLLELKPGADDGHATNECDVGATEAQAAGASVVGPEAILGQELRDQEVAGAVIGSVAQDAQLVLLEGLQVKPVGRDVDG